MFNLLFLTQFLGIIALVGLSAWVAMRRFQWTAAIAWTYALAVVGAYVLLSYAFREEMWVRAHLIPAAVVLVGVGFTMALSEQFWRQYRDVQAQLIAELEKELQTAHDMQMGLMPASHPQIEGFDIAGCCIPANHVGGDFFQYFETGDKLSLALADVTGKAMEAAIPVVMFSGILRSHMELGGSLQERFERLNRSLHSALTGRTLVCFVMGELDLYTCTFCLANGGCPYPYHFRAGTREVVELQSDAYPLGVRPNTEYPVIETQLQPGDRVVFCSDGITEADNAAREQFGYDRTTEAIRTACEGGAPAEEVINRILKTVDAFRGGAPRSDDMTCVVLAVEGAGY